MRLLPEFWSFGLRPTFRHMRQRTNQLPIVSETQNHLRIFWIDSNVIHIFANFQFAQGYPWALSWRLMVGHYQMFSLASYDMYLTSSASRRPLIVMVGQLFDFFHCAVERIAQLTNTEPWLVGAQYDGQWLVRPPKNQSNQLSAVGEQHS